MNTPKELLISLDPTFIPEEDTIPYVYTLVPSVEFGLSESKNIIVGYELAIVEGTGYDFLSEEIDNIGDVILECLILPKEGLVFGKYYKSIAINPSTDWESGLVDDYDIAIVEIDYKLIENVE